ncbi:uncharacterized protein LOC108221820 isoform X1 [Daucus carota subsp. sativus]|uniref:uncharacterized protein LOC108221820 isoform X1 n=1 Tax=Daucus carota subsp. sativus TaxID=79200 RepID=UPI003082D29C
MESLFSQVFRAVLSILNDFVAFFTACNRHQLRHGLAGIQVPMYWGTNCFHTRKVIYKLSPDHNITHWPLPGYAPTTEYNLVFTDQYQFLMLSQGSLDELNSQLEEPLPINHFRPRYP